MQSREIVLIYNGAGSNKKSVDDLQALFSQNIFPRADVRLSDFQHSYSDIDNPTFVVPGGSTLEMANFFSRTHFWLGVNAYIEKYKYVGICAGGFLGPRDAELYNVTQAHQDETGLQAPTYSSSLPNPTFKTASITNNYKAIGPFYPTGECEKEVTSFFPYCVSLSFVNSSLLGKREEPIKEITQLYLQGPGFIALNEAEKKETEVIAYYKTARNIAFFKADEGKKEYADLPAIVRGHSAHGAWFLAGTHIETCVKNSEMLAELHKVDPEKHALLQCTQNREVIEHLLRETLTSTTNFRN